MRQNMQKLIRTTQRAAQQQRAATTAALRAVHYFAVLSVELWDLLCKLDGSDACWVDMGDDTPVYALHCDEVQRRALLRELRDYPPTARVTLLRWLLANLTPLED